VEILSQKLLEATPYSMSAPFSPLGLNWGGKIYDYSIQAVEVPTNTTYSEDLDLKVYVCNQFHIGTC
jgi:hypothetical protein